MSWISERRGLNLGRRKSLEIARRFFRNRTAVIPRNSEQPDTSQGAKSSKRRQDRKKDHGSPNRPSV